MEINLFSSKIAILESKIIYFYLRSNFRGSTTLRTLYLLNKYFSTFIQILINLQGIESFKEGIFFP